MTEQEYVEAIKKAAEDFKAETAAADGVGDPERHQATARRWQAMTVHLSASTAIALCDAWLEANKEK